MLPPSILMSWFLIDRIGRKPLQVWGFIAGAVILVLFAGMRYALPASGAARLHRLRPLQHRPDRPGAGVGRRRLRRRAGADPHPQRGPVDHGDRRTHRRGDQRLRLPAAQRRTWASSGPWWASPRSRWSAALRRSCWCPRPPRARLRRSTWSTPRRPEANASRASCRLKHFAAPFRREGRRRTTRGRPASVSVLARRTCSRGQNRAARLLAARSAEPGWRPPTGLAQASALRRLDGRGAEGPELRHHERRGRHHQHHRESSPATAASRACGCRPRRWPD